MKDEAGAKHTGYGSELEPAYGSDNYKYGFEVFIPFLKAAPEGDGRVTGVGDMEVRPLKYALIIRPDFIISTTSSFGLPTGRKSEGLEEENVSFTQHLFGGKAFDNWSITANLGIGGNLNGEADVGGLRSGVGVFVHPRRRFPSGFSGSPRTEVGFRTFTGVGG